MPRSRGAFFLIEWLGQSALVATDWWTRKGIADRLGRLEYLEHESPRPPDRRDISRPPFTVQATGELSRAEPVHPSLRQDSTRARRG